MDRGEGVARRWRLNPPPNWPSLPDGWEPGPDWVPQREWGPAPVGWTLWRREGRGAWLVRHRRSAGLGSAAVLTIFVALAGPPATGTLDGTVPEPAQAAPSVTGGAARPLTPSERPLTEPAVRMRRRTPPASRERRPAAAAIAETKSATIVPSADPRDRRRAVTAPEPSETPSTLLCPTEPESPEPEPPAPDATAVPVAEPLVAGSEPDGGCAGDENAGSLHPTTSGSPNPPG